MDNRVTSRADLKDQIMGAFAGAVQPVRAPLTYRLGIGLVTAVMILLPLIYIAIIGLVAYVVYLHLVNNTGLLTLGRGRGRLLLLLVYLAPLIIGTILIGFMLKPLFSRPAHRPRLEPLSPDDEPLLFTFVERICRELRAPVPRRIETDWQVNASASFRRGMRSMLGNDLMLTIGMPLAAGLNLRQFAGVLAHEFGHFSQGGAMRLTYVIRSINHWFARVVFERDEWDESLVRWSKELDVRLSWLAYVSRFFVWLTRRVLWGLMMVGHAVSGFMMRQMEYDADRFETRLVGSDAFESTLRRLVSLSFAFQATQSSLGDFYREGRLADNVPRLVQHHFERFSPQAHEEINKMIAGQSTTTFATHPAHKDRIARARQEDADGVFQLEMPTAVLFSDFDALCERVSVTFYQNIFGDAFQDEQIFPVEELLERQEEEGNAFRAFNRFTQGTYRPDRSLAPPTRLLDLPVSPGLLSGELRALREQIQSGAAQYKTDYDRYAQTPPDRRQELEPGLEAYETLVGRRLERCLHLALLPGAAPDETQAASWQKEIDTLRPAFRLLDDSIGSMSELSQGNNALLQLFQKLAQNREDPWTIGAIRQQSARNRQLISELRHSLLGHDYPFEHADQGMTIGQFALSAVPDVADPAGIYNASNTLLNALSRLRARLFGHLCLIAEQVEATLGLEPLPEPAAAAPDAAAPDA